MAAGVSVVALGSEAGASNAEFEGYPNSYGVLHDTTLCIGCRTCELACNKSHSLPAPDKPFDDKSVLDKNRRTDARSYTVVNKFPNAKDPASPIFIKTQCNHCLEPACASACFVKAFTKSPVGAVVYHPELCVGCRYCMVACPFNIPAYEYDEPLTPRVMKCTLCHERTVKGGIPACVEDCPVEAIVYGKREDLLTMAKERIRRHPDRYTDHVYGEKEVGGTNWLYITQAPLDSIGLRTDLGHTPAPDLTREFLSSVATVDILGPTFLLGLYAISKRREAVGNEENKHAPASPESGNGKGHGEGKGKGNGGATSS